ncbi:MAG: hypothetical protein CMF39_00870 [Legionellaceae bacterium]|nr:hypothetical protein [Legionellaceae bacterium]|tara:strand:- start:299 stop:1345 length:1047 start_codon:yes stop_codon:yes gene_type:complete
MSIKDTITTLGSGTTDSASFNYPYSQSERLGSSVEKFQQFVAALKSASTTLSSLDLTGCKLAKPQLLMLADALRHCTKLQSLVLAGNDLNDSEVTSTFHSVFAQLKLMRLDLSECISETNIQGLLLGSDTTWLGHLQSLALDNNQLAASSASVLARLLLAAPNLRTLCLNYNRVGGAGIRAILAALKAGHGLVHLEAIKNDIDDQTVAELCEAIPGTKLTSLHLMSNPLTAKSSSIIAALIAKNLPQLTVFKLDRAIGRAMGDLSAIESALASNRFITSLGEIAPPLSPIYSHVKRNQQQPPIAQNSTDTMRAQGLLPGPTPYTNGTHHPKNGGDAPPVRAPSTTTSS